MLSHKTFLVKERVAFLKLTDTVIALEQRRPLPPNSAALLLATGLAIDPVYKEK
jgi:hypothetical protein